MSDEDPTPEEAAAAAAKAKALEDAQAKADEINKSRTGKGTRLAVAQTRGRSTQVITYERFDVQQDDTLPKTFSEFMDVSKVQDEPTILKYLYEGYNSFSYDAAADPVLAFVEKSWTDEVQKGFRLVVKNFAVNNGMSIEDAVALIKPAYTAAQAKVSASQTPATK